MTRTENNIFWADVESPITPKQLSEINSVIGRVQFGAALNERDHTKLAAKLSRFPKVALRAFELSTTPEDNLDFLKHYKGLKRLSVNLYGLRSLEGLEHIIRLFSPLSILHARQENADDRRRQKKEPGVKQRRAVVTNPGEQPEKYRARRRHD